MIPIAPANSIGNIPWQWDEQEQRYYYKTKDGRKVYRSNQEAYVGYSSNSGFNAEVNGIGINNGGLYYNGTHTGYSGSRGNSIKPKGYSRNAAATATDIAQGGMTKDEVQEFNMRHPNETAGGI